MNKQREIRNDTLLSGVEALVETERDYAATEYGSYYHSPAEGYMVVREETLEATDHLQSIGVMLDVIDRVIRMKGPTKTCRDAAVDIKNLAIATAIEAIHVAAAAEKLEHSYEAVPSRYFEEREDDE